jgi:hypothetical protein
VIGEGVQFFRFLVVGANRVSAMRGLHRGLFSGRSV